jgi:hypothetical protein
MSYEEISARRRFARSQMRRLQWSGLPDGKASGTAGPKDFFRTV